MKKIVLILLACVLVFSVTACKKKEEQQPLPQTQTPMMPNQMPPGQMPNQMPPGQMPNQLPPGQMPNQMPPAGQAGKSGMMMPHGKSQIVVPPSVKGQWSGAKILVKDKATNAEQEYTVKLNTDFKVPNSNLKIHVGEFLPEILFEGQTITSRSNQPNNPGLTIRVYENEKQIFPDPKTGKQWAWLFAKVPTMHAFMHSKYAITLKEGVKKG